MSTAQNTGKTWTEAPKTKSTVESNNMSTATNPGDGKFVVVEKGQRVASPFDTKEQAETEAKRRQQVAESSGQTVPEDKRPQVKQNLFG